MSTLAEIESAVEALPLAQQRRLLRHLSRRIEERPAKKKPSLHDRMKDLCGIGNSGVPDLATNKKHLEGLGEWRKR